MAFSGSLRYGVRRKYYKRSSGLFRDHRAGAGEDVVAWPEIRSASECRSLCCWLCRLLSTCLELCLLELA